MPYIDLDRGVEIHRDNATKIYVGMYVDKPGDFFDMRGRPVPDKFAEDAGFDVAKLSKEKIKREKMAEFAADLDRQMALAREIEPDEKVVLVEGGDYRVVALASGYYNVEDNEGIPVNTRPVSEDAARDLFKRLVPTDGGEDGGTQA
jgi:hypothetical protein